MDYLQVISVPVIATIVYWVINLIKYATNNNEKFKRLIPLVSAGLGAALGALCYYAIPGIIAAPNVLVALLSGASSGLSATGCHQVIKQLSDNSATSCKADNDESNADNNKSESNANTKTDINKSNDGKSNNKSDSGKSDGSTKK